MGQENTNNYYDFVVSGEVRVIAFIKTVNITEGVSADLYAFVDDKTHELAIYTIAEGCKAPPKKITDGHQVTEGYLKGKGTLTISLQNVSKKDTYYFDNDGHTKEIVVRAGQSLQWTAPHDSGLVYYEIRDLPVRRVATVPTPAAAPATIPVPKPAGPKLKLFLTSVPITSLQGPELAKLVGKAPRAINLAIIENAADLDGSPAWVTQNREAIQKLGFNVEVIDLRKFNHNLVGLLQILQKKHIIWIGGGNTFYLRWLLRATRADEIIKELVGKGIVYGGGSAGAIIAGPTLKYFETADDPAKAPEVQLDGLHLTELVVVPHMNSSKDQTVMTAINQNLLQANYKTVPLNDGQALIIDGDSQRVI